jgi:hypothetical protein
MKLELLVFGTTAFLLYNAFHDGKYTKVIMSYKKYYKMCFIAFLAFCFYLMLKRDPTHTKNLLLYTNNMVKYMPIDRSSIDMLTPLFDLTSRRKFMNDYNSVLNPGYEFNPTLPQEQHYFPQPKKRSVSETKKKYVASMQDWKCGQCHRKLSHTFEVDHKIRLEYGGGNDVSNLVALCRECHGEKTAFENM